MEPMRAGAWTAPASPAPPSATRCSTALTAQTRSTALPQVREVDMKTGGKQDSADFAVSSPFRHHFNVLLFLLDQQRQEGGFNN